MSRGRGGRRLWRSPYVFAAAALLFATGLVAGGSTFASFTAETENTTATFAGGWVGAPTGLTVTPSGYNGVLAWSPATHGLDGQQLYGVDNGTSASCPASGTSLATLAAATSTYTDSSTSVDNPRSGVNGHYVCYQLASTRSGSSWTSTASFPATVLGLVPTSVSGASTSPITGGTSTITIVYNQGVTVPASTTIYVCMLPSQNQIVLGNSSSCTATIGTIGVSSSDTKENDCTASPVQASGNSIVISVQSCKSGVGNAVSFSGPATFTPAAGGAIVSSSVGSVPQCTTSLCVATGTFS